MTATDHIAVADGITTPKTACHFVTAAGTVKPFVILRQDTAEFPARERFIVADRERSPELKEEDHGIYDPDSCFLDPRRAEAEASRRRESVGRAVA